MAMHKQILRSGFNEDFQDFLKHIPHNEVVSNVLANITKNTEFQKVIQYIKSDYFKKIVLIINEAPAFFELLNDLRAIGLDVYKLVNTIHDLLELAPLPVPPEYAINSYSRVQVENIKNMVLEDKNDDTEDMMELPPEIKAINDHIHSQEFQSIVQSLLNLPEYHKMKQTLRDYGIDVDKIVHIFRACYDLDNETGKATPNEIISSDIQDFLNRIPQNEIVSIVLDHMANIPEFQKFIKYVKSDECKRIILMMEQIPAYIGLLDYLQISGYDVYELMNIIHDILELAPLTLLPKHGFNCLSSMVDEFITIIPHEKHKALFEEILKLSPQLMAFNDYIHGQEFQSIVQSLENRPECQEMKKKLEEKGIDLDYIVLYINALFGLNTISIEDYLNLQYLNSRPLKGLEYILENLNIEKVIDYVKCDDFRKIILTLNKVPAYIEILNYIQAFGLDVYRLVNTLQVHLELDPLPIPPENGFKSLSSRMDKIIMNIPHEQLKAFFEKKFKTIPELKVFYDHILGQKFQSIVQDIVNCEDFPDWKRDVMQYGAGIDIEKIACITKALFGLNTD